MRHLFGNLALLYFSINCWFII